MNENDKNPHSLLGVQSELLQEQKANTKLTQWIFGLTIAGTLMQIVFDFGMFLCLHC